MSDYDEEPTSPWDGFGSRRLPVIDLVPGTRIKIAGRVGTFVGYWRIKNFPNVIEWQPDGKLEVEVTTWSAGGVEVSEWDESDALDPSIFDLDYWEGKL